MASHLLPIDLPLWIILLAGSGVVIVTIGTTLLCICWCRRRRRIRDDAENAQILAAEVENVLSDSEPTEWSPR